MSHRSSPAGRAWEVGVSEGADKLDKMVDKHMEQYIEALEDKRRLDWLEKHALRIRTGVKPSTWLNMDTSDIRAAIDSAMKGEEEKG